VQIHPLVPRRLSITDVRLAMGLGGAVRLRGRIHGGNSLMVRHRVVIPAIGVRLPISTPPNKISMPHTKKTRATAYRKMRDARAKYFEGRSCAVCGSTKRLELDHIDPSKKKGHSVWSWSEKSRQEELAKCQPLCYVCHLKKTVEMLKRPITHATDSGYHRGCRCGICLGAHNETCGRNSKNAINRRAKANR
jgi:hypothetical protein